jgi:hypothetical protein
MITLILSGLFLVESVEFDADKYNILLNEVNTGNLVAHWENNNTKFKEKVKLFLKIKAECNEGYEIVEGNGTHGWRPEDDWIVNRKTLICNAISVEDL